MTKFGIFSLREPRRIRSVSDLLAMVAGVSWFPRVLLGAVSAVTVS